MQVLSTTFRMCINVPHYVRVVLSTTFRMCIDVPHYMLVLYMQILCTTFRMCINVVHRMQVLSTTFRMRIFGIFLPTDVPNRCFSHNST